MNPWYITGITDAEGNFSINYNSKSDKSTFSFKVTQNINSIELLFALKAYFGCGNVVIDNRSTRGYKFLVSNKLDLVNIIIPHFEKYMLQTSKHLDFLSLKEAIIIANSDLDKSTKSFKIASIRKSMNTGRSFDERWNYMSSKTFNLQPEWIQAFIDGEGTFQCGISDVKSRNSKYLNVRFTLEISQNTHDSLLLNEIINYFGCGYLKPSFNVKSLDESKSVRSVSRAIISNSDVVKSFVDKYPMLTNKNLDYMDWTKLISLKENNLHKTESGLSRMRLIKSNMNRGRYFSTFSKSVLPSKPFFSEQV